jgi:AcrR family transcriptional regulator
MGDEWSEGMRLLWEPRPAPARGPRPGLSLDRIAGAGVEIADAEGLAAVSMQRVAALLDFTKMSLYRYVSSRAELVALMLEAAIGEPPPVDPGADWRQRLGDWSRALAEVFCRRTWLLEATVGARPIGPRELAWMEQAVAALDGLGLTGSERFDAVALLSGHVRGIAHQVGAAGQSADPDVQIMSVLGELLQTRAARYPALSAALTSTLQHGGQDQALDFGLARILDGLGLLIAQRS